jgi:hypothetical protein
MRLSIGLIAVMVFVGLSGRADAVGRMPGHTLQFLGWGYGAGYHAPIVHAQPPLKRMVHHAPGGHWLGSRFGYSQVQPPYVAPYFHPGVHPASPYGDIYGEPLVVEPIGGSDDSGMPYEDVPVPPDTPAVPPPPPLGDQPLP